MRRRLLAVQGWLLTVACTGSVAAPPPRPVAAVAAPPPRPVVACPSPKQTAVEILNVDLCLSRETTAYRVASRNEALLLPEEIVETGRLPLGFSANEGVSTDAGRIFWGHGSYIGWWLIKDQDAFFDLRDRREGGGLSCQKFNAAISAALAEIKRSMQLEGFRHCSWWNTSKASGAQKRGDCTWVKEFQPMEGIAGEYAAPAVRQVSAVVASGYLADHGVLYDLIDKVACNLVRAKNPSLIASVAVFDPTKETANMVSVHGEGCIGWVGGVLHGEELSEERLTQILDRAVAANLRP